MTTYTNLEVLTYNAILEVCGTDYAADILDIVSMTGKSANVLRGVISSLIKKGMIADVGDEAVTFFTPYAAGVCYCFGGESLTDAELELFVKIEA